MTAFEIGQPAVKKSHASQIQQNVLLVIEVVFENLAGGQATVSQGVRSIGSGKGSGLDSRSDFSRDATAMQLTNITDRPSLVTVLYASVS
jgi:hypothetical protein